MCRLAFPPHGRAERRGNECSVGGNLDALVAAVWSAACSCAETKRTVFGSGRAGLPRYEPPHPRVPPADVPRPEGDGAPHAAQRWRRSINALFVAESEPRLQANCRSNHVSLEPASV